MNSKTIVRRTMPLIIALGIIILVAISCTVFKRTKKVPAINNPDDAFLTIGDIKVTNSQVYKDLKFKYGAATLVNMIDKYLLENTKNAQGVSYLSAVTEDAINDEIEKAKFPNGRTEDQEQDDKTEATWERKMYLEQGLRTNEEIKDYYRLILAKRLYARDIVRDEKDAIKDTDISSYYQNNYKDSFWTVVIQYNTLKEANDALAQLGIIAKDVKTSPDSTTTVKKWVWADTETELTHEEIKQAHIDLYNNSHSYEAPGYPNAGDPSKNVVLGEDQYSTTTGKIVFNTTYDGSDAKSPKNKFYYTTEKLNLLSSSLTSSIRGLNDAPTETNGSKLEKAYFVTPKSAGSNYYLAYRIVSTKAIELYDDEGKVVNEDLKKEIIEKILDTKVTDSVVSEKIATLRKGEEKNSKLVIFDEYIENNYISGYDAKFKATKKANTVNVAMVGDKAFTAQELFDELAKLYGVTTSYTQYLREMLLQNPTYNAIYDVKQEKVLDDKQWKEIEEEIANLKRSFANGSFGVDPSYGWDKFLRDYNNVDGEKGLKIDLVYERVFKKYTDEIAETTQEKWDTIYVPNMQKKYDEYLSATGMHLLIYRQDAEGNIVDPEKWTAYERSLAQELYDLVITKIKDLRPNRIQTYLQTDFINAYTNAPRFVATNEQDVASQPVYAPDKEWLDLLAEDYELSKFKTAGLLVKFETLTTTTGVMVKPFEDAVRRIWEQSLTTQFGENIIIYDRTFNSGQYLETEFGYHVYVNLTTTNRPGTTKTVDGEEQEIIYQLPAYNDVLVYEERPIDEEKDRELTSIEESQVKTYYSPIRTEITGDDYRTLKLSEMLLSKLDQVTFANAEFKAIYQATLENNMEKSYNALKYVTKD